MKPWQHIAALLLLAGTLFFLELGTLGLTDVDEGNNAEAAREMLESGDWISPTFHYEPRWKKPIFNYWLISLAYRFFGVNEFSARLPAASFGVALALLLYLFLSRVRGPAVGFLGALMLVLKIEVIAIGHMVIHDSALNFFTTLSLFAFWLGLQGQGKQRHFLWLFYVGIGLGTLTKGPIGVLVPLLVAASYLLLTRKVDQFWRQGFPILGTLVSLSLALPWYIAMSMIHGRQYWNAAYPEMAGRFFATLEGHGGTVFFYIPVLLIGFFPWSGFLLPALYETFNAWWDRRGTISAATADHGDDLEFFAGLWVAVVFLFFSLSSTRLLHYIGPLFPAAAILAACYWKRSVDGPMTRGFRAAVHTIMITGYLMGLALASAPLLYAKFIDQIAREFPMAHQVDPGPSPVICGAILVVGSALIGYFGLSEQRRRGAVWAAGATIGLTLFLALKFGLPQFATYFIAPPQQLAYIAGLNLNPEERFICYGSFRPSLIFYAKRKAIIIQTGQEEHMIPHLNQPGRTMILLPTRLRSKLPGEAAAYPVLLERYGYSLVANEPMVKGPPSAERPPASVVSPHGKL
jgi:4-amino-4-deoxy-L-arabinose transferase-like glycosyltransferase